MIAISRALICPSVHLLVNPWTVSARLGGILVFHDPIPGATTAIPHQAGI